MIKFKIGDKVTWRAVPMNVPAYKVGTIVSINGENTRVEFVGRKTGKKYYETCWIGGLKLVTVDGSWSPACAVGLSKIRKDVG